MWNNGNLGAAHKVVGRPLAKEQIKPILDAVGIHTILGILAELMRERKTKDPKQQRFNQEMAIAIEEARDR